MHKQLKTINCRSLLNSPIDSVLLIDLNGTVLDANETLAQSLGRSVTDLVGFNIYELLPPELSRSRKAFIKKVLESGEPCRFKDERDGVWYDHILIPVFDNRGNVVKISIWARNITDIKTVQRETYFLVEHFNVIVENMGDGITLSDENGYFQIFNPTMQRLTEYSREDANNMNDFLSVLYPDKAEHDRVLNAIDDVLKTGHVHHDETVICTQYGMKRALSVITSRIIIQNKTWLLSVYHDITRHKQAEEALRLGNRVLEASPEHISIVDRNYIYRYVNRTYTEVHGLPADRIVGTHVADLLGTGVFDELAKPLLDRCFAGEEIKYESWFQFRNRGRCYMLVNYLPLKDKSGHIDSLVVFSQDITGHKETEEELQKALKESKRREKEILAFQKSSHAVLTCRKFEDAARSIFDSCKDLIGARAGYVALLSMNGHGNQVLFLDAGGLPCSVDPSLPMPIRGLREKAYQTGRTVYDNDFQGSEWAHFLPEGHARIDNVLFSPLVIEGKTVGLLGLANKYRGFTEHDAVMASAFGELAAIALINSRTMEELKNSEERLRSVVETANDVIITIDRQGNIVSCNNATENVFGYSCGEIIGRQLTLLMPERFREFHQRGVKRLLSVGKAEHIGKTTELVALHKDGREFPIELSIAEWKTSEGVFFTGIVRDISGRKRTEEELKQAKEHLEIKVQKRTQELQSAVGLLQEEVYERKEAEAKILFYQGQLRALMSKLAIVEEEERKRISEHIHDNISQNLAISKMNLESLQEKFPDASYELIQIQDLVEETIKFIRSLTFELSPPILHELGLIAAVEWLADKVQERYGIIVECKTDSRFKTLKGETGILLFRTIRELLHNIIKHAKAENARVSIQGFGDYMEILVEDDGAGFDASEMNDYVIKGESFGIASIRERISYMNGNFEIHSSPGEGTKVRIIVPLHK